MNSNSRIVPPAWSLYVELVFYISMGLLLSRSKYIVFLWFAVSFLIVYYEIYGEWSFSMRYFSIYGSSIAFSTGALIYFLKGHINLPRWFLLVAITAFLTNAFAANHIWDDPRMEGFYVSLFFASMVVLGLSKVSTELKKLENLDKKLGGLSYSVFLLHWPMATLIGGLLGLNKVGWELFLPSLPFILFMSYLLHVFCEIPISKIRNRISTKQILMSQSCCIQLLHSATNK